MTTFLLIALILVAVLLFMWGVAESKPWLAVVSLGTFLVLYVLQSSGVV